MAPRTCRSHTKGNTNCARGPGNENEVVFESSTVNNQSCVVAQSVVRLGRAAAPKSSNSPVLANLGSFRSHHSNPVSRLSPRPFNSHAAVHPLLCGPSFPLQSAHFLTPTPVLRHSKLFPSSLQSPQSFQPSHRPKPLSSFQSNFTLFHPSSNQPLGPDATQESPLSPALIAALIVGSG